MKKIIEEYYCDECGHKIENIQNSIALTIRQRNGMHNYFLYCLECIALRLQHSVDIVPTLKCDNCDGIGKIKEFYCYNNDFIWNRCKQCNGTGRYIPK